MFQIFYVDLGGAYLRCQFHIEHYITELVRARKCKFKHVGISCSLIVDIMKTFNCCERFVWPINRIQELLQHIFKIW